MSNLIDWSGTFDPDPTEYEPKPSTKYVPNHTSPKTFPKIAPTNHKTGSIHTLTREQYLARKAELEAQYNLFPKSRAENLNVDCYPPLFLA